MTDIVGSTEHASELGDSAWRELVELHHSTIRAVMRRHAGREIDTAGDGFFIVFDAPAAAVQCALELVAKVKELGLDIRAGLHVGEVEQMGAKVAGITVPIASRIMAAAGPGQVLVSSTVRDLAAGSGLKFEDRGVRELKGVHGEWHIYLVAGEAEEGSAAEQAAAGARARRAAAVRRARARPIWQRRPRLVAASVVLLAVVVATAGLLVWKPWQTPALAAISENSIGIVDPGRNEIVDEIPVETRPGGIAVGGGYAWITNTGSDSVIQIDLRTRSTHRIDVGRAPKDIVVAGGSVWVANSGERTVTRIDTDTGRVVGTIAVGNSPSALAAIGNTVWVANLTDDTVVPLDVTSGEAGRATGVSAAPVALAGDDNGLWVASEDAATITHLDPVTGITLAAPIAIAARPSALALSPEEVWVASGDGTIIRLDRATNRVTSTLDVGGRLSSIALDGDEVWVGDQDGNVRRLNAKSPADAGPRLSTGSMITALEMVEGQLWLTGQALPTSHRGGTLRILLGERAITDPLLGASPGGYNATLLEADGLVGFRRVGGAAGGILLPDLATSIPTPTDGGRTYTFQLRPGLVYSTGEPVRAADFRRAAERSFRINEWSGPVIFGSVEGAEDCGPESCDLSAGIVADDRTSTVTFRLSRADPDFLYKLATAAAFPVPDSVPMAEFVDGPFPGTGPYVVDSVSETEVRLVRNERFTVWDPSVRPDGYPDEIVFTASNDPDESVAMVASGAADYAYSSGAQSLPVFATEYPAQWHSGGVNTNFIELNTTIAPFDNVDARRAFSLALDRERMVEIGHGAHGAAVTCQFVSPGWNGYQPYCPYTRDPDQGGAWRGRDLEAAQALIDRSNTRGARVAVGPSLPWYAGEYAYIAEVLEELDYDVTFDPTTHEFEEFMATLSSERTQFMINGWAPDYGGASTFLGVFRCGSDSWFVGNYCDPEYDAAYQRALDTQASGDAAAAGAQWAALDRSIVDLALIVPMYNAGGDVVSSRVGNYQVSPSGIVLFDQMWVQ